MVTDGASVMECAVRKLGFSWMHCFPHRLNLVVQEALQVSAVAEILTKVRDTVR